MPRGNVTCTHGFWEDRKGRVLHLVLGDLAESPVVSLASCENMGGAWRLYPPMGNNIPPQRPLYKFNVVSQVGDRLSTLNKC